MIDGRKGGFTDPGSGYSGLETRQRTFNEERLWNVKRNKREFMDQLLEYESIM